MSEIKKNFITLVRNKTIKSPTDRGFNLENWASAWNQSNDKCANSEQLYQAGIVFYQILENLREEIKSLYQTPANADKKTMLKAYCGMANRDRFILSKNRASIRGDITALRNSNNKMNNELSHFEIANGCVDAIDIALRQLVLDKVPLGHSNNSTDAFDFLQTELAISQMYGFYDIYWKSLVWGEYEFKAASKSHYEIRQIASDLVISFEGSQLRKEKMTASAVMFLQEHLHTLPQMEKKCLVLVRKNKKIAILVSQVKSFSKDYLKMAYVMFDYQKGELFEHIPKELLSDNSNPLEINILEIIEIFQLLVMLSQISSENFSSNDGVVTINKAAKFSPSINQNDFLRGASQVTGWQFKKCEKILEFLTFDGDKDKDIWCHPVIKLGNGEITYSTAALVSPVLLRAVEHWLALLNISLTEKGEAFEKLVINSVNDELSNNPTFSNHNQAVGRRFNFGQNKNEEIDLLFRFGNTIVIGEVKSIVTTDSPVSQFRTKEILLKASEQAKRKTNFVINNLEEVSNRLNWRLDLKEKFTFAPLVITSNSICAGYSVNGVSICDLTILTKYFESSIVPLLSSSPTEHNAWFEIYNSVESAQKNFIKYIQNPPQIQLSRNDFEEKTFTVPTPINSNELLNFSFTRLVKKRINIKELINKDFSFTLKFSDDFEKKLSEVEIII